MRGPSTQDCEKSFARTGIPSANMLAQGLGASSSLVQIAAMREPPAGLPLVQIAVEQWLASVEVS